MQLTEFNGRVGGPFLVELGGTTQRTTWAVPVRAYPPSVLERTGGRVGHLTALRLHEG